MSCGCSDSDSDFLNLGRLKREESFSGFQFEILEDDGVTPKNLTGCTFLMQLKMEGRNTVFYEFSSQKGNITVANNVVTVSSISTGFNLKEETYYFDVNFNTAGGQMTPIFKGKIYIYEGISHEA